MWIKFSVHTGAGMTRSGTNRRGKSYSYYSCAGCQNKGASVCKGRHIPTATLDGIIISNLKQRLLTPDRLAALLRSLADRQAAKTDAVDRRLLEHLPKRLNRGVPLRERIGFKVCAGVEASMDGETVFGGSAWARCWCGARWRYHPGNCGATWSEYQRATYRSAAVRHLPRSWRSAVTCRSTRTSASSSRRDLKQSHSTRTKRKAIVNIQQPCSDSPAIANQMDGVFGTDRSELSGLLTDPQSQQQI